MALGASQARSNGSRFVHAWVNDLDEDACETIARNLRIRRKDVHCCDARDLDLGRMPGIDGLVFGFPCNDFSIVNQREGINGRYGGLYQQGVRTLRACRPLFFVAENVSGLGTSGNDLEVILGDLERAGYDLSPHTYRFEEYRVPQARHRIIIVGFRKDLGIGRFVHPSPTSKDSQVPCRDALEGIPPDAPNNERTRQSSRVVERLSHIRPGENAFTADLPDHLRLNLRSKATISQIYRRLSPGKPAYTVTGSGGGGTHLYHWSENRALTNRERARLQTFPDSFEFCGGKESVRRQIGMAVPPKGARAIFRKVLDTLVASRIPSQCT